MMSHSDHALAVGGEDDPAPAMKRLLVYLESRTAIATLASTCDAAVRRGWALQFTADLSPKGDNVRQGDLARWDEVARWGGPAKAAHATLGLAGDLRATFALPQWWDNVLKVAPPWQTVGYMSKAHQRAHVETWPCDRKRIEAQPVVGWAYRDHLPLLLNWGPRPRVVLFTMKLRVPERWRNSWRGRLWYFEHVCEAEQIAEEYGADLTIKSRKKNGDPWWFALIWAHRVWDECVYPLTSLSLLQGATCAMHFNSGAGLEARIMRVPQIINWPVPQEHLDNLPGGPLIYRHMYTDPLEDVITYDDARCGERMMDVIEERA